MGVGEVFSILAASDRHVTHRRYSYGTKPHPRVKVCMTRFSRPQRSSSCSVDRYKSWLPEYSAPAAPGVYQVLEEVEGVRVRNCHNETGSSASYALPSSCSATCRTCRDIPYSLFMPDGPNLYVLHNHYLELSKSADNGCCLCWFFVQQLRHVYSMLRKNYFRKQYDDEASDYELVITLRRPEGVQPLSWILLSCGNYTTRIYWSLVENSVYHGRVSLHSEVDEIVRLTKSWISACLKEHGHCRKPPNIPNQSKSLPNRLIHIFSHSDAFKIRLVETAGHERLEDVPYLTLSHCWGREPSANKMTTKENVQSRMVDIPFAELPKTIQDALVITAKLGFHYIWIDAICIVQDSVRDWQSVCRSMAAIYSNSVCTIAASAADNDHGGCLVHKDIDSVGWIGIEFPYPEACDLIANRVICDQKWPPRLCTTAKEIILHPAIADPRSLIESEPLSKRGWCLQERLLSPRVLYFTEQELVWECETTWSFEDSLRATLEKNTTLEDSHPQSKRAIYDAWFSIVRAFTNANLTRFTDRLPALSGLADEYLKKLPNEEYVAGLWKGDLIRGLLWAKNGLNARSLRKPPAYLAPSWSWASVDGPIFFPPIRYTSESSSLLDVKVTVAGLDPLGEISGGHLLLRGRLKSIRRGRPVWRGCYLPPPRALVELPPDYSVTDVRDAESWLSLRYTLVDGDENDTDSICGQIYFDVETDSSQESLHCLQMAQAKGSSQTTIYILALARTRGSGCAFRRVGIGEILRKDWFRDCEESSLEII